MSIGIVRALAILASQRPSLPSRAVARRSRVERRQHGLSRIPTTWIDPHLAPTATIVHLHGGAYVGGELSRHWEWLEEVGRRSGAATAMIHYRMPPRFPFPTALDDALHAIDAMGREGLLRPGRWVLTGDSAGGGLALGVAQVLAHSEVGTPAAILLSSPWVDLTSDHHGSEDLRIAARLYAGAVPVDDPRISPLFGELGSLPPVQLITGSEDIIVEDSRRLHSALEAAGGEVDYLEEPGQEHNYPLVGTGAVAQAARRRQIAAVRDAVGLEERPALS